MLMKGRRFWLWFLQFWCRSIIPQEEKQVDEMGQIVLGAGFACFVTSWDRHARNGMTRGGSRTSKCWRAPVSLCRGLCGAARQQFITSLLSMEEHFVLITGILIASVFHYCIACLLNVGLVFDRSVKRTVVMKVCSIWRTVLLCCLQSGNYMLSLWSIPQGAE